MYCDYFNHISAKYVPKVAFISPIFYLYIDKIKAIVLTKCGRIREFVAAICKTRMTEMWPWFWWYMGEILVRYGQHLVHIWLIYDWISPNVTVRYDFSTFYARVRGGQRSQKCLHLKSFPVLVRGGWGVIKYNFVPKFKIVQIILGGKFFLNPSLICSKS